MSIPHLWGPGHFFYLVFPCVARNVEEYLQMFCYKEPTSKRAVQVLQGKNKLFI